MWYNEGKNAQIITLHKCVYTSTFCSKNIAKIKNEQFHWEAVEASTMHVFYN